MLFFWNRERIKESKKDVALEDRIADLEGAIENIMWLITDIGIVLQEANIWNFAIECPMKKEAIYTFCETFGDNFSVCHLEDRPEELERVMNLHVDCPKWAPKEEDQAEEPDQAIAAPGKDD